MADKTQNKKQKKVFKDVKEGKVYVLASFNNTIVTVTDGSGNVLGWDTSGSTGFKGTKKSTPYAATSAVEKVLNKVKNSCDLREVEVFIKGPGAGRDAALRAIRATGLKIALIADLTPIPHNGPRPKKKRRA